MPTIAIRRSVVEGLAPRKRQILRWLSRRLELGEPARYSDGTNEWFIFDDHRITLRHLAVLGAFAANVGDVPGGYDPSTKTRAEIAADVRRFLASKITWPESLDLEDVPNPYQAVLDAQGAPAAVRAADSVPPSLTPVVEDDAP